jgi:hypothetical protein
VSETELEGREQEGEEQEGEEEQSDPLAAFNERLEGLTASLEELRNAATPAQEQAAEASIEDYFAQRGVSRAEIEKEIERLADEREYGRFRTMAERLGAELAAEADEAGYEEQEAKPKPKPKPRPRSSSEDGSSNSSSDEDEAPASSRRDRRAWEPFP